MIVTRKLNTYFPVNLDMLIRSEHELDTFIRSIELDVRNYRNSPLAPLLEELKKIKKEYHDHEEKT
jgi:hypothetical protein